MKNPNKLIQQLLICLFIICCGFYASAQSLNGIYTINHSQITAGRNFQTFTATVDTLKKYGVSGQVIFNIASGTYTERVVIPAITGASDTNTITFQSAANHADSVVLNYAAGTNVPIVTLDGVSYINFKYITVASTTTNGRAFQLTTTASHDSIVHCKINAGNTGIYANVLSGGKNVFSGNTIIGGAGISLMGTTLLSSDSNVIVGNIIQATARGLDISYNSNAFIVNNSISSISSFGIWNMFGSGQHFYHNSVIGLGASSAIFISYSTGNNNNEWKNNIITNSGAGNAMSAYNTGTNNTWDYNLYYTNGTNLFSGVVIQEIHSIVANPYFISDTDLRLGAGCKQGVFLAGVTTDIEGNIRDTITPTMGAYEYSGNDNIAIDDFSPAHPATGVQDLVVRVKNVGNNAVTSFNISYVLNNDSVITQHWNAGILAPCDTVSVLFTGINFLITNELTVYTSLPNGNNDTYNGNDTFRAPLHARLNGTYTIGHSGATFASFSEAVDALVKGGVSGHVVFEVQSGTYTEQILIPDITGASDTSTITFQSAAHHADSVTLNYASGYHVPIVRLYDAKYITFKWLTVASSITDNGIGFLIGGVGMASSNNIILYCKISAGQAGIYSAFNNHQASKKNVFSHNTINISASTGLPNPSYGIYILGNSTMSYYTDSNVIAYNTIKTTATGTAYGLYLENTRNLQVNNNTITSDGIGIYIYYSPDARVINNSIIGNDIGIRNQYGFGQRFFHNTISSTTSSGVYVYYNNVQWSGNEWKNNIITGGTNFGMTIGANTPGINNSWDYNLYYNYKRDSYNSNSIATAYANWQASGQDSHSVLINPDFVSETDLHLISDCGKQGILLADVTTDIEGETRNNPPTIGAYEYLRTDDIAIDSLLQPVNPIVAGVQDIVVCVKNIGINLITSFNISYELNNDSSVSHTWSGTLSPCDTVSVTLHGLNMLSRNKLTLYTTLPNNNSDTKTDNDTLKVLLYAPLKGVYTIGDSGTNFRSFSEAVAILTSVGVSGHVVFNVQSGTYTEQITIPAIIGASDTSTITFQSAANHADSVTLNYAAEANPLIETIVKLDSTSYISFKYITVASTTSRGRVFVLTTTASYNNIIHCKINAGDYGIYAHNFLGKNNLFGNNVITNSNYGIYLQGRNSNTFTDSNTIVSNVIHANSYGLYFYHNSNIFVANNSIISNAYGIRNYYGYGQRFYHNSIGAQTHGIYVNYPNATDSANEWKNNIIANLGAGSAAYITNLGANNTFDYNLYYTPETNLFNDTATAYATWQATGQDAHSVVLNPEFISDADLHLLSGCGKLGILLSDVTTDIEGNPRSNLPTIGAYEYLGIDNIAVDAVLQPAFPATTGLQDMVVRVKNTGLNTITSFNVGYILNNGSAVLHTWTGNLAPCDTVTVMLTGANQVNIPADVDVLLKIFTANPNNTQDSQTANDTISLLFREAFSGTYTIGGAGANFPDFTTAVNALQLGGVSGHVIFNVKTDTTFTENLIRLNGSTIQGSNLYSITFQKAGIGNNPVVYGINGTSLADAVITLQGISNIIFDGIDVEDHASNTTNIRRMEHGYKIINVSANTVITGSNNNIIKNSKITLNKTNTSSIIGILQSVTTSGGGYMPTNLSGANCNNRYENITISNSNNGILLTGDATYSDSGNVITASAGDNTIIDNIGGGSVEVYGIQLVNQRNAEVSNSIVRNLTTSNAFVYGIYLNNTSTTANYGNTVIKNNRVYNITTTSNSTIATSGASGIRVDVSPNATSTVFNNVVYGLNKGNPTAANASPLIRGIAHCVLGSGNASYFNNTVSVTSGTSANVTSTAFFKGGTGTATTLQNNIFVNTTGNQSGNAKHYAIYNSTNNSIVSSNNLLWSGNNNSFTGYHTVDRKTLSDWQTATTQDRHSVAYLPNLNSNNHLYPNVSDTSVWALNGRGIHLDSTIISTDINGNPRPTNRIAGVPDIGAYQFTPDSGVLAPLATVVGSIASNSTQTFLFGGDTVARIKWNASSTNLPDKIEVRQYSGVRPPGAIASDAIFMYFYTDVKANGTGSYNYDLDIYYKDAWLGTTPDEQSNRLYEYNNTNGWQFPGNQLSVDITRNILTGEGLSQKSALYTGTDIYIQFPFVFPVQLISFKANAIKNDVLLTWATASEVNSSHFVVERLVSGNQWSVIGKRGAKGNSSSINNYQFTDQSPFTPETSGHQSLYYRLRIVDNDGSYEYSKVVSVSREQQATQSLTVYPNPFNNHVNVALVSTVDGTANINIVDITGRDVQLNVSRKIVKGNNVLSIDTNKLNSGVYFLSIELNGEKQLVKLVKQ